MDLWSDQVVNNMLIITLAYIDTELEMCIYFLDVGLNRSRSPFNSWKKHGVCVKLTCDTNTRLFRIMIGTIVRATRIPRESEAHEMHSGILHIGHICSSQQPSVS